MTDVHKTGSMVLLKGDLELLLAEATEPLNFEASLKNIPDLVDYIGEKGRWRERVENEMLVSASI